MRKYIYLIVMAFLTFIWIKPKTGENTLTQAYLAQSSLTTGYSYDNHMDGGEFTVSKTTFSENDMNNAFKESSGVLNPMSQLPSYYKSWLRQTSKEGLIKSLWLPKELSIVRIRGDGVLYSHSIVYKDNGIIIINNGSYG